MYVCVCVCIQSVCDFHVRAEGSVVGPHSSTYVLVCFVFGKIPPYEASLIVGSDQEGRRGRWEGGAVRPGGKEEIYSSSDADLTSISDGQCVPMSSGYITGVCMLLEAQLPW